MRASGSATTYLGPIGRRHEMEHEIVRAQQLLVGPAHGRDQTRPHIGRHVRRHIEQRTIQHQDRRTARDGRDALEAALDRVLKLQHAGLELEQLVGVVEAREHAAAVDQDGRHLGRRHHCHVVLGEHPGHVLERRRLARARAARERHREDAAAVRCRWRTQALHAVWSM